jgi:hypothetical protein
VKEMGNRKIETTRYSLHDKMKFETYSCGLVAAVGLKFNALT